MRGPFRFSTPTLVILPLARSPGAARAWAKRHGALHTGSLTLTVFKDVNQVAGSTFMGL
jgi:hypothetical protein